MRGSSQMRKEREARVVSSHFIPIRCRLAALGFSLWCQPKTVLGRLIRAE